MSRHAAWRAALVTVPLLTVGCSSRPPALQTAPVVVATPPERMDTVLLLPDEGVATAGRLVVRSSGGEVALEHPWAAARVPPAGPPQVAPVPSDDLRSRAQDVLTWLPPAPSQFTLYFNLESEVLTEESRARLSDVRAAVTGRSVVEVFVSGHTDRSGAAEANVGLGLTRAASIRDLLIEAGVPAAAIRITSHGEATPLVPTRDGTFEPRNRRVEITVR